MKRFKAVLKKQFDFLDGQYPVGTECTVWPLPGNTDIWVCKLPDASEAFILDDEFSLFLESEEDERWFTHLRETWGALKRLITS